MDQNLLDDSFVKKKVLKFEKIHFYWYAMLGKDRIKKIKNTPLLCISFHCVRNKNNIMKMMFLQM